jgi:glycosyltransferase involved in cell wall biosynthesis
VKLAIVVDWLTDSGGGESVLSETLKTFPGASVHALIDIMSPAEHERLGIPAAHTTWLQRVPRIERTYRSWLPLMPRALRTLDVSHADVVLAISHAVAKAVPVRDGQRLLCLCLSPMRYAWDLRAQYLAESGLDRGPRGAVARLILDRMQEWDYRTAARVDAFASISRHIQARVQRSYGRDSTVIYPPVDVEYFSAEPAARGLDRRAAEGPPATRGSDLRAPEVPPATHGSDRRAPEGHPGARGEASNRGGGPPGKTADRGDGPKPGLPYVTASRFVPYKRMDLIVRAFAGDARRRLVVIGDGPDRDKVRAAAGGAPNITFLGHAGREVMRDHLRNARAFVFAAEEDFGIVPVEAQACGTPVIAYGKGGALETVVPLAASLDGAATGLFFAEQTVEAIREALERFERAEDAFSPDACRANARRFEASRFRRELAAWVEAETTS